MDLQVGWLVGQASDLQSQRAGREATDSQGWLGVTQVTDLQSGRGDAGRGCVVVWGLVFDDGE